jgi:SNF2 family DNA or RNA helicase
MELFDYQKKWVKKGLDYFDKVPNVFSPKFNLFPDMGLGKTLVALDIVKHLEPSRLLIVCPKSLMTMWEYNAQKHLGNCVFYDITNIQPILNDKMSVTIVNYEKFLHIKDDIYTDICIFDEAHKLKNCNSKTHKCISKYVHSGKTLCLTGTPITRDLMDLFGILTCIGPKVWNGYSESQFRNRYIVNGGAARTAELKQLISEYTVFGKLTDYIEMPPFEDIIVPVALSNAEYTYLDIVYKSKQKAITRISEAQQFTSKSTTKRAYLDILIKDLLQDGSKIVIFVKFTEEYEYLMERYKDICVGINGSVKDRNEPVLQFQTNDKIKIFIGNLQTASLGSTLTAAHDCIFYTETYTWGDMDQSRGRIYRISQTHPCRYYHILASNTIDEMIYQSNVDKTDFIEVFKNKYGGE